METEKKPRGYWTLERCIEDAANHSTRGQWSDANHVAYSLAHRRGWIEQCCAHMGPVRAPPGYWTLDRCAEDAAKYCSPSEWKKASGSAYRRAMINGWLDQCCSHMTVRTKKKSGHWSLNRCLADAAKYSHRIEWSMAGGGGYSAAARNGWLEKCCAHMGVSSKAPTDNNVVYIWRDDITNLHKIGITSDRIGEQRINTCSNHNDMDPRIVLMLKVDDARAVEAELLELGTDPELDSSIDGYTEFRVLTNEELGKAVSTAYQYAVAA